jgi:hypothetical protein
MKRLPFALAAALLIALVWFLWPRPADESDPPAPSPSQISNLRSQISDLKSQILQPPPEPRSTLADNLNSSAQDIHADLRVVLDVIDAFRTNLPRDGNPVGTNAEITAALAGRNQLRLALIPPDHPAINQAGELCDRWGTPFFFHAESATKMEVRSAGPDQQLWTDDDVVLTP